MAYPNILTYKGNGLVQYVSNTQFTALAEVVLEHMVSEDSGGVLTTNASFTSIGTFTDNYIVGETGTTDSTLTFTDKTFYQNLAANTISEISVTPVEWNVSQGEVKRLDPDALVSLADEILDYLITNDGPGTYYLGTSAPVDGGTWTQAFSIVDKVSTLTDYSPISYVWVKTSGATTLTDNILTTDTGGFKYMTTSEIQSLVSMVRSRIIDTEIGTYALAETAPVTGTWEAKGTVVDRYYDVLEVGYTGAQDIVYTGAVPATYSGSRYFGNRFYGPGPRFYFGDISYEGTVTSYPYSGADTVFSRFFAAPYVGTVAVNYTGTTETPYTGLTVQGTYTDSETLTLWRRIA